MKKISIALMLCLQSQAASAAINNANSSLVDAYAECAAINDVVAKAATKNEQEYEKHLMHGLANGGRIVAMIYADEGKISRSVAENSYQAYFKSYTDQLKPNSTASKSFVVMFEKKMETCKLMNIKIPDILAARSEL